MYYKATLCLLFLFPILLTRGLINTTRGDRAKRTFLAFIDGLLPRPSDFRKFVRFHFVFLRIDCRKLEVDGTQVSIAVEVFSSGGIFSLASHVRVGCESLDLRCRFFGRVFVLTKLQFPFPFTAFNTVSSPAIVDSFRILASLDWIVPQFANCNLQFDSDPVEGGTLKLPCPRTNEPFNPLPVEWTSSPLATALRSARFTSLETFSCCVSWTNLTILCLEAPFALLICATAVHTRRRKRSSTDTCFFRIRALVPSAILKYVWQGRTYHVDLEGVQNESHVFVSMVTKYSGMVHIFNWLWPPN